MATHTNNLFNTNNNNNNNNNDVNKLLPNINSNENDLNAGNIDNENDNGGDSNHGTHISGNLATRRSFKAAEQQNLSVHQLGNNNQNPPMNTNSSFNNLFMVAEGALSGNMSALHRGAGNAINLMSALASPTGGVFFSGDLLSPFNYTPTTTSVFQYPPTADDAHHPNNSNAANMIKKEPALTV